MLIFAIEPIQRTFQGKFFALGLILIGDFAGACETRDALENAHFMIDELNLDTESPEQSICRGAGWAASHLRS